MENTESNSYNIIELYIIRTHIEHAEDLHVIVNMNYMKDRKNCRLDPTEDDEIILKSHSSTRRKASLVPPVTRL